MPTERDMDSELRRAQLYDALVTARDEQAWAVRYRTREGEVDDVVVFASDEQAVRREFHLLTTAYLMRVGSGVESIAVTELEDPEILSVTEW